MKWGNCSAGTSRNSLSHDLTAPIAIPLAGWADAQLAALADMSGTSAISALSGTDLLSERATLNGFRVPGSRSAGGGCKLHPTRDGHVALTLARDTDRELLPALFGDVAVDRENDAQIAARLRTARTDDMVAQGRSLGLAIAALDEQQASPACLVSAEGDGVIRQGYRPLVLDLSALWAGPLAAHLLGLGGAQVIKVESRNRADPMRDGDAALFARLNQHKANVALDLRIAEDRNALIALIHRADIVIAASRPRALLQLGIDADALVRQVAGLVWITITGHGTAGEAANWIGFGDDCSVAGGLSAALLAASGKVAFGGDACADPLTGIYAARIAMSQRAQGKSGHYILSMSAVIAHALAAQRAQDEPGLTDRLRIWSNARGAPFPAAAHRATGPVADLGQDNDRWLGAPAPC